MGILDGGKASRIGFFILHFFQFVLAITICGLYGVDLDAARKAGKYADGKWTFAEVVAVATTVSTFLLLILFKWTQKIQHHPIFAWETLLFILWITVFAIFGTMYIKENPEGNADIQRMKNAVWVVLAETLLFLIGSVTSFVYWWMHRGDKTRFTGRATV